MKALIAAASTLALATVAAPAAQAQMMSDVGLYGSLGYAHSEVEDVNLGAIQGRLGARFTPYLGAEGELGFGVNDDEVNIGGANIDVGIEHQAAIYGVGFIPMSDNADLFARLGYGTTEVEASAGGLNASADGQSWNYGVGGQYFFDGMNGVRADWTRYDFEDDGEADVWSVSYVRKF